MKVDIAWKSINNIQTKTFKDENDAMEWIRSHCSDIVMINDMPTYGEQLSHFEIMDFIRKE